MHGLPVLLQRLWGKEPPIRLICRPVGIEQLINHVEVNPDGTGRPQG